MNQILGLAVVDQKFWQDLQKNPLTAIEQQGFELTPDEQAILCSIPVNDLSEFSQNLMEKFGSRRNE